jgi:hypothetical protein
MESNCKEDKDLSLIEIIRTEAIKDLKWRIWVILVVCLGIFVLSYSKDNFSRLLNVFGSWKTWLMLFLAMSADVIIRSVLIKIEVHQLQKKKKSKAFEE